MLEPSSLLLWDDALLPQGWSHDPAPGRPPSLSPSSLTVLDWLVQPKPRWLGGNGWLLDGPEEVLQGTCPGARRVPRLEPALLMELSMGHRDACAEKE